MSRVASLLLISGLALLVACQEVSQNASESAKTETTWNPVPVQARFDELNPDAATGEFLHPEPDSEVSGNLRFHIRAAADEAIEQVYIGFGEPETGQAFQLCDETCSDNGELEGWVSGLNPARFGLDPGELDVLLLVQTSAGTALVDDMTLQWQVPAISLDNVTLDTDGVAEVTWVTEGDYSHFNIHAAGVQTQSVNNARAADIQWLSLGNAGSSGSITLDAEDIDDWVTFWVEGVGSDGVSGVSDLIAVEAALLVSEISTLSRDYQWFTDLTEAVTVDAVNGLLVGAVDSSGADLSIDIESTLLLSGSGGLEVEADGSFIYVPEPGDTLVEFQFEVTNGAQSVAETASLALIDISLDTAAICTGLPTTLTAGQTVNWELDPYDSMGSGAEFSLSGSPGGGLGLSVSGTTATFNSPTSGLYSDITLQATNALGSEDSLGPFTIEVLPGTSGDALAPWEGIFQPQRMIPAENGALLAAGNLQRTGQPDQLLVARILANGQLDSAFGTGGYVTKDLPVTTLEPPVIADVVAADASRTAVVRDMVLDRDALYVWGAVERDDGDTDWLSPLMVKLDRSTGDPVTAFADDGLWTAEFDDEVAPVNHEAGAFMVESSEQALLAVNELTADRRPADMMLYRIETVSGPDLAEDELAGNPSSVALGNRNTVLRPQKIILGPEPDSFMLLSQALSPFVTTGELHVTWHDNEGEVLAGYGVEAGGNNLGYQLLFPTPTSRDPTVTEAVLTDDGRLFMTGQLVTADGFDRRIYLIEMHIDYAQESENDLLLQLTLGDLSAGNLTALGMQPGADRGVELAYLNENDARLYVERFPASNERDEAAQRSADLPGAVIPMPVAAVAPNGDFRYLHSHPSAPQALQLSEPTARSVAEYQPFDENCGIVSRFNAGEVAMAPRLRDFAMSGGDLLVSLRSVSGWRVDRLADGLNPVGLTRGDSFVREFPEEGGGVIAEALATDSTGRLLVMGGAPGGSTNLIIRRYEASGEQDMDFGVEGGEVVVTGASPSLVLDSQDRAHYAFTESGQLSVFRLTEDGQPDESGSYMMDKSYMRLLMDSQDRLYALLQGDAIEVVRFNPDLTLDTSFGDGGSWLTPENISLTGAMIDSNDRVVLYTGFGAGVEPVNIFVLDQSGAPDPTFASNGVLELESAAPALFEDQGHRYPIVEFNEHFYFAVNEVDAGFAVRRVSLQGDPDTGWGNLGSAPVAEPIRSDAQDISGMVVAGDRVGVMWEGVYASGLTWLNDIGYPETTRWFGPLEGDRATALETTANGRLLLLNTLENQDLGSDPGTLWGIRADGSNIEGFGQQDPALGELGTLETDPAFSPIGTVTSAYGFFSLPGTDVAEGPEWRHDFYGLRDVLDGDTAVDSLFDLVGSLFELFPEESFVTALSERPGNQGVIGGYSYQEGAMSADNHLALVDRFGQAGAGLTLDPTNDYPNGQPFETRDVGTDARGRVYLLLQQLFPEDLVAVGRFVEDAAGELELDTSFSSPDGWNFGDGTGVPHVMAVSAEGEVSVARTDSDGDAGVIRFTSLGDLDNDWGDGGVASLSGPDFDSIAALHKDKSGALFLGGQIDGRPTVVRVNQAGSETHRWGGELLGRTRIGSVADFAEDPRGHLHVLVDAYHQGVWQSRVVRLPVTLVPESGQIN
ncbi:MAG: hypothetical protein LAT62_06790 [Natronospirillum sp.]|uniref:hypothetical protein n=1 Tax=Natronospirillum sp. TaxID=2812955 RepID=UPI0025DFE2C8|nr:hypothetical protein [Natronospirillum sp.]MCH8551623.1 hypothetical protein [Natronospirillum sp.]